MGDGARALRIASREGLDEAVRREMEALEAIGYVAGSRPATGRSGVLVHLRDRAQAGLNFYVSGHAPEAILEDFVLRLGPDGEMKGQLSLLAAFERAGASHDWRRASRAFWSNPERQRLAAPRADIFHTNSLAVLRGRLAGSHPAFREGNLLVSMCHLDTVAVVDPRERKVVWSQGGFAMQHDPSVSGERSLMVFDNHWRPGQSRIVELDAATGGVTWEYRGRPDRPFYSRTCGTAQPLANGNVLITESDNGRAFEVARDEQLVWEFRSPHRAGERAELVATLFELRRLPPDFPVDWARDSGPPGT